MSKSSPKGPRLNWPNEIQDRYGDALRTLYSDLGNHPQILNLEYHLVSECEGARLVTKDPFEEKRKDDKAALKDAKKLASAAKAIASYMRRFPFHGGWIASSVMLALSENGLNFTVKTGKLDQDRSPGRPSQFVADGQGISAAKAFERLAEQLGKSAVNSNPAGRGPWLWRSTIPGATYPDARRFKRPPDRAAVLAFHLVLWLRGATTRGGIMVQPGLSMPQSGKPHFEIAQSFVLAAFPNTKDRFSAEAAVRSALRSNMQYSGWEYPPSRPRTANE